MMAMSTGFRSYLEMKVSGFEWIEGEKGSALDVWY